MKVLVISDVHANINALRAVWDRESDADLVCCAGDMVDYGPFPREVIDWLRERRALCVRGNHDRAVTACFRGESFRQALPEERTWAGHNAGLLSGEEVRWLESLPESVSFVADGHAYLARHQGAAGYGTIETPGQFDLFWDGGPAAPDGGQRRAVVGHTHFQGVRFFPGRRLWLNPGSISYRAARQDHDLSRDAQYVTISAGRIEMKRLDYDRRPVYEAARRECLRPDQEAAARRFFAPDRAGEGPVGECSRVAAGAPREGGNRK